MKDDPFWFRPDVTTTNVSSYSVQAGGHPDDDRWIQISPPSCKREAQQGIERKYRRRFCLFFFIILHGFQISINKPHIKKLRDRGRHFLDLATATLLLC